MDFLIPSLVLIPIVAMLAGMGVNDKSEKLIFGIKASAIAVNLLSSLVLLALFFLQGKPLVYNGPVLYHTEHGSFSVDQFLDGYSFVYLIMATVLTGLVAIFSKYYMHRDKGYKRFFNNLNAFYLGVIVVVTAGNFETLFIGWEILGVTSFFLIGFYRERYLPVKNALKVVSLYRVADIALLLGIWLNHHYFMQSIHFYDFANLAQINSTGINDEIHAWVLPLPFILAALVKSAQFPFSSWLPRAMEGPTTSSAIFYGSLSVHIGVFLLIRVAPLWEPYLWIKVSIGALGIITCTMASYIASVQSTVKTQIAYSGIAQIGIMLVEVALGWYAFAMVHFVGHAFLRSYQLLLSPSVLGYRIHNQFFDFTPPAPQSAEGWWNRLKLTIYVWSLKEFNLDRMMKMWFWRPLKQFGYTMNFMGNKLLMGLFVPTFAVGLYIVYHPQIVSSYMLHLLAHVYAIAGILFISKAFVERESAAAAWVMVILNQLFITISIGMNEQFDFSQVHLYLSGIIVSFGIGLWAIRRLAGLEKSVTLHKFQGHVYEHPRLALLFALACLGLAGFPITPTFLGEDLLLGHIHSNQYLLMMVTIFNLILDGLVVFRIYSRLFLGPQEKGYHETAYRSS